MIATLNHCEQPHWWLYHQALCTYRRVPRYLLDVPVSSNITAWWPYKATASLLGPAPLVWSKRTYCLLSGQVLLPDCPHDWGSNCHSRANCHRRRRGLTAWWPYKATASLLGLAPLVWTIRTNCLLFGQVLMPDCPHDHRFVAGSNCHMTL